MEWSLSQGLWGSCPNPTSDGGREWKISPILSHLLRGRRSWLDTRIKTSQHSCLGSGVLRSGALMWVERTRQVQTDLGSVRRGTDRWLAPCRTRASPVVLLTTPFSPPVSACPPRKPGSLWPYCLLGICMGHACLYTYTPSPYR